MVEVFATLQGQWTVSLLPRNKTPWEVVVEGVDSDLVGRNPVWLIPASRSAQDCPVEWLPYLAAERSVDEYDSGWTEAKRRAVVAGSFVYHQHKGTRHALEVALAQLNYNIKVIEWFETYPLRPAYTFRLTVTANNNDFLSIDDWARIVRLANFAKNAHTKIEDITFQRLPDTATVYIGAYLKSRLHLRILPPVLDEVDPPKAMVFVGGVVLSKTHIILFPRS